MDTRSEGGSELKLRSACCAAVTLGMMLTREFTPLPPPSYLGVLEI